MAQLAESVSVAECAQAIPVEPGERILLVDALRGFALFGILLINIEAFNTADLPTSAPTYGPLDSVASAALLALGQAKFVTLFSFLFGASFSLQLTRLWTRVADPRPLLARRQVVLLAIGLLHYVFIWEGDVLTRYAATGLVLLAFVDHRTRPLLKWAAVLLGLEVAVFVLLIALAGGAADRALDPEVQAKLAVYHGSSYIAFLTMRADLLGLLVFRTVISAPLTLGLFLAGMAAARAGLLDAPDQHRPLLVRVCLVGLILGGIGGAGAVAGQGYGQPAMVAALAVASLYLNMFGLSAAYAAGFALIWLAPAWRRSLVLLAPVGRLALTNYVLQSLIGTLLFDGYGLGWFGSVGPAAGIALAMLIFAIQVPLSHLWLARFRYGPLEWLWRSLTYGRRQPLILRPRSACMERPKDFSP